MTHPTTAQQRGMAYAPMPFALISFFSSSYVIYHILFQEPQKRKRLYHRLVLAMNFALLPLSASYVWSTLAVPEGTPSFAGAMGTVNTCTVQGFINIVFALAVPTYYGSLALQAFLGLQNNFKEEKYRWIEIPIHTIAYLIPSAYAIIIAVTENFNPHGSVCSYSKAPWGCESDPDVPCERGEDIQNLINFVGLSQLFLYFIFPPSAAVSMYCWLKKKQNELSRRGSIGMSIIRENARKETMRSAYLQISVYLFSFWFTFVFSVIDRFHQALTGEMIYNFTIFANCVFALQGFVFTMVYFALQKIGEPNLGLLNMGVHFSPSRNAQLTVSKIRLNVRRKNQNDTEEVVTNNVAESFKFNIFDGVPDPNSPWARFIYQDSCSENEDTTEHQVSWEMDEEVWGVGEKEATDERMHQGEQHKDAATITAILDQSPTIGPVPISSEMNVIHIGETDGPYESQGQGQQPRESLSSQLDSSVYTAEKASAEKAYKAVENLLQFATPANQTQIPRASSNDETNVPAAERPGPVGHTYSAFLRFMYDK